MFRAPNRSTMAERPSDFHPSDLSIYMAAAAILVAVATLALPVRAGARAAAPDSCAIDGVERIVAIGDVHGAYDRFVAILRSSGLIDQDRHWSGGRAHLVQTGDGLDRGPDSRKAPDLLKRLQQRRPAPAAPSINCWATTKSCACSAICGVSAGE